MGSEPIPNSLALRDVRERRNKAKNSLYTVCMCVGMGRTCIRDGICGRDDRGKPPYRISGETIVLHSCSQTQRPEPASLYIFFSVNQDLFSGPQFLSFTLKNTLFQCWNKTKNKKPRVPSLMKIPAPLNLPSSLQLMFQGASIPPPFPFLHRESSGTSFWRSYYQLGISFPAGCKNSVNKRAEEENLDASHRQNQRKSSLMKFSLFFLLV